MPARKKKPKGLRGWASENMGMVYVLIGMGSVVVLFIVLVIVDVITGGKLSSTG